MEVVAPLRRLRARRELAAARRAADAELVDARLPSPRLAWRTSELCSDENRRALAEALVDVVRSAESRFLPSASPLNRPAVRAQTGQLLRLAATLGDLDRAVWPRGVLLVERLVTDGASGLYGGAGADTLGRELDAALAALEDTR